jgi:hypothetical protein
MNVIKRTLAFLLWSQLNDSWPSYLPPGSFHAFQASTLQLAKRRQSSTPSLDRCVCSPRQAVLQAQSAVVVVQSSLRWLLSHGLAPPSRQQRMQGRFRRCLVLRCFVLQFCRLSSPSVQLHWLRCCALSQLQLWLCWVHVIDIHGMDWFGCVPISRLHSTDSHRTYISFPLAPPVPSLLVRIAAHARCV